MKLDKKKKIQLLVAAAVLAILLIIIFSINSISDKPNISKTESSPVSDDQAAKISTPETPQKSTLVTKANNSNIKQQQDALHRELLSLNETYKNLAENVKNESQNIKPNTTTDYQPAPRKTPTPNKSTSPLDRQASQSAVFFPGGAPRPVNSSNSNYSGSSSSTNSNSTESSNPSDQTDAEKDDLNTDNNDSNSTSDSDLSTMNNGYNNSYMGGGGGSGFIPVPAPIPVAMTLQYSPSGDYNFIYKEDTAGQNPLDNISQNLTLTITINNPSDSFTSITFCNSQFSNCLSSLELSNSSLTISTNNVAKIKPTITNNSYTSTSITIESTSTNYMVPKLYFLLSNSGTTKVQASASFPITSNCTANEAGNIATCTVTNSSSATMNITVNGTTSSSS